MSSFQRANRSENRLRMALTGPAKSGKTLTACRIATGIVKYSPDAMRFSNGRIAFINTEKGSPTKYIGMDYDGIPIDFDIIDLSDFSPSRYTELIQEAGRLKYLALIIDSLTHAWSGPGGALELKDRQGSNSFAAWSVVTPMHNAMIEAIVRSPCHVIATMRSKMEYVLEEQVNPVTGAKKNVPRKVGMEPIQRQGMEYEFDILGNLDQSHVLTIDGSRCPSVDGLIVSKPSAEIVQSIMEWLRDGVAVDHATFATQAQDLVSVQQAEAQKQQAQQAAAAQQARQQQLLAMASGGGEQQADQSASNVASTPAQAESAPFTPDAQATQAAVFDRIAAMQEIVAIGEKCGMTPAKINDGCKAQTGKGVNELPDDKLSALLNNFRKMLESAAAPNSTAA